MFNERQLNQCYSDYKEKCRGRKEDYFAVLYLAHRFAIPQKEALKWVTFGGFDYGIDAYYLDDQAGNLFIYQFKWSDKPPAPRPWLKVGSPPVPPRAADVASSTPQSYPFQI